VVPSVLPSSSLEARIAAGLIRFFRTFFFAGGTSPAVRKAAAVQLGEVQRSHPQELFQLLNKVRSCLHLSPTVSLSA
jgi:sulfur relay (sulfurtransferase) DsrC/TusE family protein